MSTDLFWTIVCTCFPLQEPPLESTSHTARCGMRGKKSLDLQDGFPRQSYWTFNSTVISVCLLRFYLQCGWLFVCGRAWVKARILLWHWFVPLSIVCLRFH
jgi:hypothetical protein